MLGLSQGPFREVPPVTEFNLHLPKREIGACRSQARNHDLGTCVLTTNNFPAVLYGESIPHPLLKIRRLINHPDLLF